ncbi:divergent PAP2 family protein [Thiomicrorhabdus sp. ZW0627]|uniref:divergent PAP2 family protein n=1 Tax=Thiomicrorhabdus sp. ZW0627 TaxID=3039774 RepID=UPI0024371248|nr:divergent PAP2 family protein [Thiomicrorhabdus sp. ZW0627]MDG6773954.1 divergent PAP2 family protein [Thiomicrorhabdus sp. ZW0627]
MDLGYLLIPFFTWLVTGVTKFAINSIKAKKMAFELIGYGGMPSNHSAIVSSVAALIALREGIDHPAFAVALGVAFVVMLDASSLRRQVGKQAEAINRLNREAGSDAPVLRERMGHSKPEILAGILVGCLCALVLNAWPPML